MTRINTEHLLQCIKTLESSLVHLEKSDPKNIEFEVFRNAVMKGFELTLEISGKLLRKALKTFTANPHSIDELTYKEVLRHAAKHSLLDTDSVKRWFTYRDNRNNTAHDYGIAFAKTTLKLLPHFLNDAYSLANKLKERFDEPHA